MARHALVLRLCQPAAFDRQRDAPAAGDERVGIGFGRFVAGEADQPPCARAQAQEYHHTRSALHRHMVPAHHAGVEIDEQTFPVLSPSRAPVFLDAHL
jgi:hypothetical protein